ncbi:MAG: hypothetical protein AAB459_03105 [Patescibacteria group bacterium]
MGKFSLKIKKSHSRNSGRTSSFSYYRTSVNDNRNIDPSKITRERLMPSKRRSINLLKKIPQLVIAILIFSCIAYVFSLSVDPRIVIADQQSLSLQPVEVYKSEISKILKNSPLNFTKITINTKLVAKQIEDAFPEIQSSSIALPLLNRRPIVHIRLSTPAAIVHTSNGVFVMDSSGKAIMNDNQLNLSERQKLPKIHDQSQLQIDPGKGIMKSGDVTYITTFISELEKNKYKIKEIILPPVANEVQFHLADKPYFIKANLSLDPYQQVGTFLALQNKLTTDNSLPTSYIDVRVEERAYYL